jgi:hypothetical protein
VPLLGRDGGIDAFRHIARTEVSERGSAVGQLDFNRIVAVFIPGLTLAIASWLVVHRVAPDAAATGMIERLPDSEWLFTFVVLAAALFFGACLRSLAGLMEAKLLDGVSRRRLGITEAEFDREWDLYIDTLDTAKNPYISDLALSFFFDFREGISLAVLSAVLITQYGCYRWWAGALSFLLSAALLYSAREGHFTLAERRHRLFGEKAREQVDAEKKK